MGAQRKTRRGGMLVEKQDQFVRLIAHGVTNSEACGWWESTAGPKTLAVRAHNPNTAGERGRTIRRCAS